MTRTQPCCQHRPIKRGRFGLLEDPVGQIVVTRDGKLYDVIGTRYRETPGAIMLTVRTFDRETTTEIAASCCLIVPGHYHEERS